RARTRAARACCGARAAPRTPRGLPGHDLRARLTATCRGRARGAARRRPRVCRHRPPRAARRPNGAPPRRSLAERQATLFGAECLGELVQLALEGSVELVRGQLDSVIGDAVLGKVVGADLLGALARADL